MSCSNWTREDLKLRAKNVLRVNYWQAFLVSILLGVASSSFSAGGGVSGHGSGGSGYTEGGYAIREFFAQRPGFAIGAVIGVLFVTLLFIALAFAFRAFVGGPLEVSCQRFFTTSAASPHTRLDELGFGFKKEHYMNVVKTMFMKCLYIFLWTLLFIIPGIIKAYSYRMVPFILTENPDIDTNTALQKSEAMMNGQKWAAFVLDLSFIGWYLLGMLTCGIGILFVAPYHNSTNAQLYLTLKDSDEAEVTL